ncbi:MAG TPA: hypothetical protein VF339_10005 [Gammaproteobacteria bacterium]
MSEDHVTEARRRLKVLAARAVEAARTATAATSSTAAKAAAAAKAAVSAASHAPPSSHDDVHGADERDEKIARLEQEIEAERARAAELERTVKALEFKLDVLERSYAKQLADARTDGDAAKRELAEVKAELADARHELKQVAAHRDRLRDMYAFDGRRVPPELRERQPGEEDTIARLLNAAPDPGAKADAPSVADEPETGDLLSPDLVFDANDDEEDGDGETKAARG